MTEEVQAPLLNVSVSPHIRHKETVPSIMLSVVYALVPALIASVIFFGMKALILTITCVISSLLTEWLIVRYLYKKPSTLGDFTALVTALLLAFNLPPDLPVWMAVLGSVFAIGVVKMAFGGLGNNFVNPALAGRAFLLASYPATMTSFSAPIHGTIDGLAKTADAITGATPLASFKSAQFLGNFQALDFQAAIPNLITGNVGGCIGETSVIALVIGAVYLLYRRIIGLAIPVVYIGTVFILYWIFNGTSNDLFCSDALIIPVYQIFSGGLMLGALFMATDMVTSPMTRRGRAVMGFGCGLLTFVIRKFGGYPEGVSYSILLMNLIVPLIDRYIRPKIYGKVVK